MKIWANEDGEIMLGDVFNGIGVRTDAGDFGICQRDGGIEVMHQGELVYAKYAAPLDEMPIHLATPDEPSPEEQ